MTETPKPRVGQIVWHDFTVADAERVRDFYAAVVGWRPEPVDMGGYADYNMIAAGGTAAEAGVCHARGQNAGIPPQWLLYIVVADLEASMTRCTELGGTIVRAPVGTGSNRFGIIRDPAGAVCALVQEPATPAE